MRRPRLLPLALAPVWAATMWLAGCGDGTELDTALGGETTRQDASRNSFGLPAPTLTNDERLLFEIGDSFFTQNWVTAPASTDARDGLGPTFNAQACASCHVLDGRGSPPDPTGDEARLGLLVRLSIPGEDPITGGPLAEPTYGDQFQDRSILDVPAEGSLVVTHETIEGTYGDGTPYELVAPSYDFTHLAFGPMADDLLISPRLAPLVIGMGLLEAIPTETLLELADPDDSDGDGISGRVNMAWDAALETEVVGRFGWKANAPTVEQQIAGAFFGDIGITSSFHPDENCPSGQDACAEAVDGGSPELTDERLDAVTFYSQTLSVPAMRVADLDGDELDQVLAGFELFDEIGCSSCHTPTLTTGDHEIDALTDQTIHPYTDLLLHDMGEGLADGRGDFDATGSEWRTPPLWGIGLIEAVNGERFLLHDGRARTMAEAILWHGGEAEASKEAFRLLDLDDREAVLAFLESL